MVSRCEAGHVQQININKQTNDSKTNADRSAILSRELNRIRWNSVSKEIQLLNCFHSIYISRSSNGSSSRRERERKHRTQGIINRNSHLFTFISWLNSLFGTFSHTLFTSSLFPNNRTLNCFFFCCLLSNSSHQHKNLCGLGVWVQKKSDVHCLQHPCQFNAHSIRSQCGFFLLQCASFIFNTIKPI